MFAKFLNARQKLGYSKLSNKRAEQNVWREEFFQWWIFFPKKLSEHALPKNKHVLK